MVRASLTRRWIAAGVLAGWLAERGKCAAAPGCALSTDASRGCADDPAYARCAALAHWEAAVAGGREESSISLRGNTGPGPVVGCMAFARGGFCESRPTEMAQYCCLTFDRACEGRSEEDDRNGDILSDQDVGDERAANIKEEDTRAETDGERVASRSPREAVRVVEATDSGTDDQARSEFEFPEGDVQENVAEDEENVLDGNEIVLESSESVSVNWEVPKGLDATEREDIEDFRLEEEKTKLPANAAISGADATSLPSSAVARLAAALKSVSAAPRDRLTAEACGYLDDLAAFGLNLFDQIQFTFPDLFGSTVVQRGVAGSKEEATGSGGKATVSLGTALGEAAKQRRRVRRMKGSAAGDSIAAGSGVAASERAASSVASVRRLLQAAELADFSIDEVDWVEEDLQSPVQADLLDAIYETLEASDAEGLLSLIEMFIPYVADFIAALFVSDDGEVPSWLDFTAYDFYDLEIQLVGHGREIVEMLLQCGDCTTPLTAMIFEGSLLEPQDADARLVKRVSSRRQNRGKILQLYPQQFAQRGLQLMHHFLLHLSSELEQWAEETEKELKRDAKQIAIRLSMDFETFLTHQINALRATLPFDDLGGLFDHFFTIMKHSTGNVLERRREIFDQLASLYTDVFKCNGTIAELDFDALFGEPLSAFAKSERIANAFGDDLLRRLTADDVDRREALAFRNLYAPSVAGGRGGRSQKMSNFAPAGGEEFREGGIILSESSADEPDRASGVDESAARETGDATLSGQPCWDRPGIMIDVLMRAVSDMDCEQLIQMQGCSAIADWIPADVLQQACPIAWASHCGGPEDFFRVLQTCNLTGETPVAVEEGAATSLDEIETENVTVPRAAAFAKSVMSAALAAVIAAILF